jgi:formylglycine-generating enzyme required for sulfatase activity
MKRETITIPRTTVRIGLEPDEADRLARELAEMEEQLREPGLGGFDVFDVDAATAVRRDWLSASMPAHDVEVGPFEIDVYPVTVAEWKRFMADTGARAPDGPPGEDRQFVTGISWKEAMAYAHHHRVELPTEAEWECAARDRRSFFTWGNYYFPHGELAFALPVDRPYDVGSRPKLASRRGVHDLLGHFGEYCWDPFAPYDGADLEAFDRHFPDRRGHRTVRGGYDVYQDATCVSRRGVPETERRTHIKFRCVRRGIELV